MNNRQWTIFEGRPFRRDSKGEIRVTIQTKGVIFLNRTAYELIGQPAAVELRYDGNRRIVGLKPIDPRRPNAFPIKMNGRTHYRTISAAAFFQHIRLRFEGTNLVRDADFTPEGILELPLDTLTTITRGAR